MAFLMGKDAQKKINDTLLNITNIYNQTEMIEVELEKCKKLSKHESTKELIVLWDKEYAIIKELTEKIHEHEIELKELIEEKKLKKAKLYADELDEKLESTSSFLDDFLEKLKQFTSYEHDSMKMALNLKERLKEVNQLFDQNLKVLDVYNTNFIESTSIINYKITEFEELQAKGEYSRARQALQDGNDTLSQLEIDCITIIESQTKYREIEKKLSEFEKIKEFAEQQEFLPFATKIETDLNELQQEKEYQHRGLITQQFLKDDKEGSTKASENLADFQEKILTFENSINKQKLELKKIIKTQDANNKLMELFENLIKEAIEEKEVILNLYQLENSAQIQKINTEDSQYRLFKEDYQKLNELISIEEENFEPLYDKVKQSNMYLNKILDNLKSDIKVLAAIRHDEIEIREKINVYYQELICIEFYINKEGHTNRLNPEIVQLKKEIEKKLKELDYSLEKEVLDISFVRTLDDIIEELLTDYISRVQIDIKQRKGAEKLVLFFNKSVANDTALTYSNEFLKAYQKNNYRKIIHDIHAILVEKNRDGDKIYKKIVNTVKVDKYEGIIG